MKRIILHIRPQDEKILDEYIEIFKRTGVFPKKWSKEGYGEYYRRVIMGRLQNMTLKSIAYEHSISPERVRQIWCRFKRYCEKHGHDLSRELMGAKIK